MPDDLPYFRVALNLPHAGRVARRILHLMPETGSRPVGGADSLTDTASRLEALLSPSDARGGEGAGHTAIGRRALFAGLTV